MKFKISANISNEFGAPTILTEAQLEGLTNGITTVSGISLSSGDEVQVVCDLLNRYSLDTCKYYYSGNGIIIAEVAESYNLWNVVSTNIGTGFIEIPLTGYKPRWVRLTFSVATSAEVYEIEIYNSEVNILFGSLGQFDSYGFDASGNTVQAVQVFNNTWSARNINVFVEDYLDEQSDESIAIGLSYIGPFYKKHERGLSFPGDFHWDNGVHSGTIATVSGHLTISGVSTSGTYYSPVFDISGYTDCRFFWEQDYNFGSRVDYISSVDSEYCFGVRAHNIPPSGVWSSGSMPTELDHMWSLETGSLLFGPVPNNTILEFRDRPYIQFIVTLSGVISPHIYKAGVEAPITVSGVGPNSYADIYLYSDVALTAGSQLGLVCWYKE